MYSAMDWDVLIKRGNRYLTILMRCRNLDMNAPASSLF